MPKLRRDLLLNCCDSRLVVGNFLQFIESQAWERMCFQHLHQQGKFLLLQMYARTPTWPPFPVWGSGYVSCSWALVPLKPRKRHETSSETPRAHAGSSTMLLFGCVLSTRFLERPWEILSLLLYHALLKMWEIEFWYSILGFAILGEVSLRI